MKKYFLTILSFLVFSTSIGAAAAATMPFQDVEAGAYYYKPLQTALSKKIVSPGKYFYPGRALTRAEFTVWTINVLGLEKITPETPSFSDVPKTHWAYPFIETAKKYSLVSGTANADGTPTGKFGPGLQVNRASAAVMIMKAFLQAKDAPYISFPDLKAAPWAESAIKKATALGFFSGYPDKTFGPGNPIRRAEGITVLMKVKSKLDAKELTLSFATSTPIVKTAYTESELLKKIETVLPSYIAVNMKYVWPWVVFFAIEEEEGMGGWYRLSLANEQAAAEKLFGKDLDDLFMAALSPDSKELFTINSKGKITVIQTATLEKKELGVFAAGNGTNRYSDPVYSPDGKYIILFDRTEKALEFDSSNGLLVVNASTKNISGGTFVKGFWMTEGGGGELEKGFIYSNYTFLENDRVRFGNNILNLFGLVKE